MASRRLTTSHEKHVLPCSVPLNHRHPAQYREFAPSRPIAPYVVCAWSLSIAQGDHVYRQRVLPDGCADIIWIGDTDPIIVGPMTRSVISSVPPGTRLLGLRFRPGAAGALFGMPATELSDDKIPLRDVWRQWSDDVSDRVRDRSSLRLKLAEIERQIARRCVTLERPDPLVSHMLSWLSRHRATRIDRLALTMAISERQLRRRFSASVGYSPQMFHGILRFQRVLAMAKRHPDRRLDELAVAAGYADQPHMTREVARFARATPGSVFGHVDSALVLSNLVTIPPSPLT